MPFTATTAIKKIAKMRKRLRILQGGSSAGKTIGIMACLIQLMQTKDNWLISVVSESFPHLSRGAIRDFLNIMQENGYYEDEAWNRTTSTYIDPRTKSKIEFFSADTPGKVRGPRRHVLFLNEANNLSYETYTQLSIRTSDTIYIDYNPVAEFWAHEEIINKGIDHDFAILTYKDNEALSSAIVQEIESRRGNKYFWSVYGEGKVGEIEGKIYKDWAMIDEIPHEARLTRYGLDFGYTNDPTAIVALYYYNGGYILDEITYQKGLSNKQIADILKNLDPALVMADSAEPKSVDEIKSYGVNILPVTKGRDSVNQGIQRVQEQRISMTSRSVNGWKEYRNYMWMKDKDGIVTNDPSPIWNHLLDAVRYGFDGLLPTQSTPLEIVGYETGLGGIEIPIYNL